MTSPSCARLVRCALLPLCMLASALAFSQAAQPGDSGSASAVSANAAILAAPNVQTNAVVKVFATSRAPDAFKPWVKQSPQESTGSGVVIAGNRILTNAHVVSYASLVQVQANGSGDKLTATVVAIAPGIDLAVLKLAGNGTNWGGSCHCTPGY